jgi:thymidine phosphorylase
MAASALGAGRIKKGDPIDPAVGIVLRTKVGDRVERGEPVGEIHARSEDDAALAASRVLAALEIAAHPIEPPTLVHRWLEPEGV